MIPFDIKLDVKHQLSNELVRVNTNNRNSLDFNFTITQGGEPFDLTGKSVRVAIVKPDKTTVFNDCEITDAENGKAKIILDTQAYIVPGLHVAEVMIYKGTESVAVTTRFTYDAIKGILDEDTVQSANDWQSINKAIADAEGILIDLREKGTGVDAKARENIGDLSTLTTSDKSNLVNSLNSVNQQLAQKPDKGDVSVYDINKNLGKLDQTFMTDDFLQQIAGDAPINAVPADESIDPIKTTFLKVGKNLFNKLTVVPDFYVSSTNGELVENTQYYASDFIIINPSTVYTRKTEQQMAFYDESKNYISGESGNKTFTTPSNAKYIRVTVPKPYLNTYQIERGTDETIYEPYEFHVSTGEDIKVFSEPENNSVTEEKIPIKTITKDRIDIFKLGKNLFNKEAVVDNVYVSSSDGILYPSSSYFTSEFILVKPLTNYARKTSHQMAFYDENKNYISGFREGKIFKTPNKCRYIRVSVPKEYLNTYQIEEGSTETIYEPHRIELKVDNSSVYARPYEKDIIREVPTENLVLWSKADSIDVTVGSFISEWKNEINPSLSLIPYANENRPIFKVRNGLPTVEFTRNGETTGLLGSKRLRTPSLEYLFNGRRGISIYILAEKYPTTSYELSKYETPLLLTTGSQNALVRVDVRNKLEVRSRRVEAESLSENIPKAIGMCQVNYGLSLYEAHIDFYNKKSTIYQDGRFMGEIELTSSGVTADDIISYITVGDVSVPASSDKTGFNGCISEILVYNHVHSRGETEFIRNYLMNKWKVDELDSRFSVDFGTLKLNEGVTSTGRSLSLIATKKDINMSIKNKKARYQTEGYLYLDEGSQKVYYSSGRYDNPQYIFTFKDTLTGLRCENYIPYISRDGDIIFVQIRSRGNVVVYPSGDYNNPKVVDFTGEDSPIAGLMDSGAEFDYDNNYLLIAEYWNPATTGGNQYIWKVEAPYQNKSNWRKVLTKLTKMESTPEVEGSIRHFHTLKRDFYSGHWYANTGDQDYQAVTFESTDNGETWNQIAGGNSQIHRTTGIVFAEDGAYWGTDSHLDHALYKAPRKNDGIIDFTNIERLSWLSILQPTYRTIYLNNPHGLLFLGRAEERLDFKYDLLFWSFKYNRLYRVAELKGIEGDTGERIGRFGFGNQAITDYQTDEGLVLCGATSNWQSRPMTIDILGNSIDRRINNTVIKLYEKQ